MAEYRKYILALRKCAIEHDNDETSFAHIVVSDLCRDTANLLETLEQESIIHAKWERCYSFPDGEYWKCSHCNELIKVKIPMHYCNNCGAKMDKEDNNLPLCEDVIHGDFMGVMDKPKEVT